MPTLDEATALATATATRIANRVTLDSRGQLIGMEGVLDQIAQSVARAARDELLPVLQRDTALQREIGGAAGTQLAKELAPAVWVGVGCLVVIAGVLVYNATTARQR